MQRKNIITKGKTLHIESDMRGTSGSQDIPNTLFKKIASADIFLADVTLVNQSLHRAENLSPNSNVMIELGFAAASIGWDRVLLLLNTSTHKIEQLPFDIRQRSVLWFTTDEQLLEKLMFAIDEIIKP